MASRSAIEWTESTWNPVTGCSKISPGCKNCYAERMARRLQAMGQPNYVNGFAVATHEHVLELPLTWRSPQIVFVNSMSDLFHRNVPSPFIARVFAIMNCAHWHTYQILTKRSERLAELDRDLPWADHIWMGVSVETDRFMFRIDDLRATSARVKFLSLEPLLGPLPELDLEGIDWVIVGGESGPRARPMKAEWVVGIRDQCLHAGVPFFFKQWGGFHKKRAGRVLDGKTWDQMPALAPSA
ncbi:MAG: phage Gp37/Gp68 family protein [Planctomycetota bacterium]